MPVSAALHAVITGFYSLPGQFEVNLNFGSFFDRDPIMFVGAMT